MRACVQPIGSNCTAPYRFGEITGSNTYGDCVKYCGIGLYASVKTMTCVSDCWGNGFN